MALVGLRLARRRSRGAASVDTLAEPASLAVELAQFTGALHRIDPADGPPSYRSGPLSARDAVIRAAIAELAATEPDTVDADAAAAVWEGRPVRPRPLRPGRLDPRRPATRQRADHRRLTSAVIDFGCLGLGDPAVDLLAAWYLL